MLEICPISLKEANAFVEQHHRHHKPVTGHKFSIDCTDGEKIVGVAIVGRPVSRYLDDSWTLEVNRLCTDVVPVVRGKWNGWHGDKLVGIDDNGDDMYRHYHYNTCSECGRGNAIKSAYCPNCGAKMDLED